jgi:hypothetical protein
MTDPYAATTEDGSPRVFVGVHRPTLESILALKGNVFHQGVMYQTVQGLRAAWQEGVFDRAMYRDMEEVSHV